MQPYNKEDMERTLREMEWDCLLSESIHQDMDKMKQYTGAFVSGILVAAGTSIKFKNPFAWASAGYAVGVCSLFSTIRNSDPVYKYNILADRVRTARVYGLDGKESVARVLVSGLLIDKNKLDKESDPSLFFFPHFFRTRAEKRLADHKKALLG